MQTVFQLLTGDAWAGFYLDAREVRFPADKYQLSPAWVTLYFVFFLCTMRMKPTPVPCPLTNPKQP